MHNNTTILFASFSSWCESRGWYQNVLVVTIFITITLCYLNISLIKQFQWSVFIKGFYPCDQVGSTHATLLLHTRVPWLPVGKGLVGLFGLLSELAAFSWNTILFERTLIENLFRHGYLVKGKTDSVCCQRWTLSFQWAL